MCVKHQPLGNLATDPLCGELRFQLLVPAHCCLLINMRNCHHLNTICMHGTVEKPVPSPLCYSPGLCRRQLGKAT